MIEIKITKNQNEIEIYAKGHAKSAEKGKDIICAFASSAISFLDIASDFLKSRNKIENDDVVEPGNATLTFNQQAINKTDSMDITIRKIVNNSSIDLLVDTATSFFKQLSIQYPDYVSFSIDKK